MEQRRDLARSKYQEGANAYSAGRFKDAVDLFLAADHLAPSAPLSFNIARAYERLGDDAGALRWYRDYLRRNPTAPNAATVHGLVGGLAHSLEKKGVQQVTVLSSPAAATVTVDDQPLGVTPWTGELAPGKHHVLLSLRGYTDTARDFELPAGEPLDLSLHLEQATATPAPVLAAPAPVAATNEATGKEPAPGGRKLGIVPWVTLGAGAAALGAALTFEVLRRSAESDAKGQVTQLGYQDRLQSEQGRQTASRVLLGVGGALAAAGGVMLLLDGGPSGHRTSAGVFCVPGACGASARGQF